MCCVLGSLLNLFQCLLHNKTIQSLVLFSLSILTHYFVHRFSLDRCFVPRFVQCGHWHAWLPLPSNRAETPHRYCDWNLETSSSDPVLFRAARCDAQGNDSAARPIQFKPFSCTACYQIPCSQNNLGYCYVYIHIEYAIIRHHVLQRKPSIIP